MKMINPKYMIILAIGIGSIMNLISVLLKPNFLIFVNVFITYFGFEILYYKLSNDKFRWFYILVCTQMLSENRVPTRLRLKVQAKSYWRHSDEL
jgi:hypothetical protein